MDRITDDLWGAERDFRLPGGVVFRSRMTAIDLGDGELVLHSPVDQGDAGAAQLAELGEVRWIVAPNALHYSDLAAVAARYPKARVVAGPALRARLSGIEITDALESGAPAAWRGKLLSLGIEGAPRLDEHVFFHAPSGTLICADFVFNIREAPNFLTRLVLSMVGCNGRFAQSRSMRWVFMRDREALARSVDDILRFDFQRVVMCHGEVVESGGHELLQQAVRWIRPPMPAMLTDG